MNRKGFVSLYALMLLESVLLASLTAISSAAANHLANGDMPLFDAQIVTVYRIRERLHQWREKREEETKQEEGDHEAQGDDASTDQTGPDEIAFTERFCHDDVWITMTYREDDCDVQIDHMSIRIVYRIADESILDMVYL